jgi:UDP-glucuronate 4-epimerase
MRILVTGSAGFIGFHLSRALTGAGHQVIGLDAMTPYYDVRLKEARLKELRHPNFHQIRGDLNDPAALAEAFAGDGPEIIVHLAAQAGVRYSLEAPLSYADANVSGTIALLEAARAKPPKHILAASSSSVYGMAGGVMAERQATDQPVSLYAATKKATEAITHSYAHLFRLPVTCLRFFTVYGPWGRPDMALFKFVERITAKAPIEIYGGGEMARDFTFVSDTVASVMALMAAIPGTGPAVPEDTLSPVAPWRVVNVAGGRPVPLMRFVEAIETAMGQSAHKQFLPMQAGDVVSTAANPALLEALTGHVPQVGVENGVAAFVSWYRSWRAEA